MNEDRNIFIIDTSVLLYDMQSIHSFSNSDLIIPLVVLDELDRFKDKPGLLGESARYVNRFLDDLRSRGNLHDGILLDHNQQNIRVELNNTDQVPGDLDPLAGDNKIISVALTLMEKNKNKKVTVVTKDINFRVKCDALQIGAEDYYKDHIIHDREQIYSGIKEIELSQEKIDEFFTNNMLPCSQLDIELHPNQFIVGKSKTSSLLGIRRGDFIKPIRHEVNSMIGINPKNKEQKFALSLLVNKRIQMVTLSGLAGSGKTFLALMAALSGLYDETYERIIITRSIQPVGREMGFLPGDLDDKMQPWLSPIIDNFRFGFKDLTYFEMMRQKGQIEIAPLAFMRGRTFNNSYIIVDEAQNATIHELKTIITRVGDGSKIVLLGDIGQIDTPYIDSLSNGLTVIVEKLKNSNLTGHVSLRKGERSDLATLASKVL